MKFSNPYLEKVDKIELIQRWILVHSFLYYELSTSIVSDKNFDKNCKQLIAFKNRFKNSFKRSRYYYVFKNFDGNTGFDLYSKLNDYHKEIVKRDALFLYYNKEESNGKREKEKIR